MEETYRTYLFNPPHYFVSNAMYMVTEAILHNQHFLNENRKIVLETILERSRLLSWELLTWTILNKHYHFIGKAPDKADTISQLRHQVHSITAIPLNQWDITPGRQVWFNYWDTYLTYENAYPARLHYAHLNPVKHELVENALDYPFRICRWFIEQDNEYLKKHAFDRSIDRISVIDDF